MYRLRWDRWFVTWRKSAYYGYKANDDGHVRRFGGARDDYGTNVLAEQAVRFVRSSDPAQPLFLFFAPHAPHTPAVPAPGDRDAFRHLAPWRPRSYDEADISDKPDYLARQPRLDADARDRIDRFRRRQLQT